MGNSEWLFMGMLLGIMVGVLVGMLVLKLMESPASIVFERDEKGRIVGIYYVPSGKAR